MLLRNAVGQENLVHSPSIWAVISPNNIHITDALEWIARQQGIGFLYYYLDSYITLGVPDSTEYQSNMSRLLDCCSRLGCQRGR